MAEFKLHGFGESGNAYKAALMLRLTGADWELAPVAFFDGATRSEVFRNEINEMGEAPVLEHKGRRLTQSGVILTYLARETGKFGAASADEELEILRWILFDNHKFTSYFATLRFLFGLQKTGETPVTEFLRGRTLAAWGIVEKHLARQDWLVGNRPTIADLSLAGYVFYPEDVGFARSDFPAISAWSSRIADLPGWAGPYELMPRARPA